MGKTILVVFEQVIFMQSAPFPWWSDLFYLLTLPCFFLAPVLWPGNPFHRQGRCARVKVLLDTLLLLGAATALSWYFFLTPLFLRSTASWPAKAVSLAYPLLDLGGFLALLVVLLHPTHSFGQCTILRWLLTATAFLILADSWRVWQRLYASGHTDAVPDLLFLIASLLLLLAGLAQFRLAQRIPAAGAARPVASGLPRFRRGDLLRAFRFLLPFLAVLFVSSAIEAKLMIAPLLAVGVLLPHLVMLTLLLLVILRQGVIFLQQAEAQREQEATRANEQALRETNRQLETFLGIVSHELKTPLSSLLLSLQMLQRHLRRQAPLLVVGEEQNTRGSGTAQGMLETALLQLGRLSRLVNDLVDSSRIQATHLVCHGHSADLAVIVDRAVEEQRQVALQRSICLHLPEVKPVLVWADEERIGQVVTNYLTNALKYSAEDRPVEVGLAVEGDRARVWVLDQGPGIPPEEQARIWERFHRVPGIEVQSGSGIGLGLGLHISQTIIEQHDGQVGVESVPGQGSTFWFTLPVSSPPDENREYLMEG